MKYLLFAFVLLPMLGQTQAMPAASFGNYADLELQLQRNSQMIERLREENNQMRQSVRSLERAVADMGKTNLALSNKLDDMTDIILQIRNDDIANLEGGQQQLYGMIDVLNWGTEERDCKSINALHQQIKNSQSPDGNYTLRYLCFDGRPIHLGTEVHQPPK